MLKRSDLVSAFRDGGFELWAVGGAVRDALRGEPTHDLDYATNATPETVEALLRPFGPQLRTIGQRFGTIGALVVDDAGSTDWSEITTFRGEAYSEGHRWPD